MRHALYAAVQAKQDQVCFQAAEVAAAPAMSDANDKNLFLLVNQYT